MRISNSNFPKIKKICYKYHALNNGEKNFTALLNLPALYLPHSLTGNITELSTPALLISLPQMVLGYVVQIKRKPAYRKKHVCE